MAKIIPTADAAQTDHIMLAPAARAADIEHFARADTSAEDSTDAGSAEFDVVWTTGATVRRSSWELGAYDEELVISPDAVDLVRMQAGIPVLTDHRASVATTVGVTVAGTVKLDGSTGRVRVRMSRREDVAPVVQDIQDGVLRSISVGYRILKAELVERDGQVPLLRVVRHEPLEISLVPVPADAGAVIELRAGQTAHAAAVVRTRIHIPTPADAGNAPEESQMTKEDMDRMMAEAATAERTRATEIRAVARKLGLDGEADALVESGSTVDAARAVLIDAVAARQATTTATGVRVTAGSQDDAETRAAAVANAVENRMNPTVVLTDSGREFRGLTLVEAARKFLVDGGNRSARSMSGSQIADAVFGRAFQATTDFPALVGNAVGRTLRRAYEVAPRNFAPLVRIVEVPDFRPVTRVAMSGAPELQLVAENGTVNQGNLSAEAETYKIDTYARVLRFTRQLLINDDLGGLERDAGAFGAAAARKESDLVWGVVTGNPLMSDGVALFDALHENVATGGAVSVEEVAEMERILMVQTAPNGDRLNLGIRYIAVGASNNLVARRIVAPIAANMADGVNPYAGTGLIIEPRLTGTAWYGFASTDQVDLIELAFLNGQRGVQVYVAPEAADFMGREIRVSLDVGAKAIDHRGMVKNLGA